MPERYGFAPGGRAEQGEGGGPGLAEASCGGAAMPRWAEGRAQPWAGAAACEGAPCPLSPRQHRGSDSFLFLFALGFVFQLLGFLVLALLAPCTQGPLRAGDQGVAAQGEHGCCP